MIGRIRIGLLLGVIAGSGCGNKTGFVLEVTGSASSVTTLELIIGQRSFCDRWVEDTRASHTKVDVRGRDLQKNPYDFLVEPVRATDIKAEVVPIVLARAADGQVLGEAAFGALHWSVGKVKKYAQGVELLVEGSQANGPTYVSDDGCVCLPGQPWMGTGSGSVCDASVITSFDRLADTRGCELPVGAPLPRACDGQQYPNEVPDRGMPCFSARNGACRVAVRNCHDDDGYAYDSECVADANAPALPDSALCDAYLTCEHKACGDLISCLSQALTVETHVCTLRIALTNDGMMHPCADGDWVTTLATSTTAPSPCPAALLDGTAQPPFTLGFRNANQSGAQPIGDCPLSFGVDQIDASSYDEVPYFYDFLATLGDKLVGIHMNIVVGCADGVPSLVCQ